MVQLRSPQTELAVVAVANPHPHHDPLALSDGWTPLALAGGHVQSLTAVACLRGLPLSLPGLLPCAAETAEAVHILMNIL